MTTVKAGQVWQDKNMGGRITIVRKGPKDDNGDTNNRWLWVKEGSNPDYGTWMIAEHILVDDYVLVKEAP